MKRRARSTHIPLLLIGLLLTVPLAALVLNAVHVKGMKSWPYPINITSDNEFTADNGVSAGSGTKEDPYIIENLIIDYGVRIYSTTKYLIIRNCIIRRAPEGSISYFPVIEIGNARNIRFENCVITCGGWGVFLNTTKRISLINCTIHDLLFGGIWAYFDYWAYSDLGTEVLNKYLVINSCNIYNVEECAILLDAVHTGAVTNCTISDCGEGIRASFAVNVTISGNRITNVEEAAIWLDTTDTAWFDFNYTSGIVADNKIHNCTYGLVVMLASNLTISGNIVDGCSYGFGICGIGDSAQLYHDIDSSNLVNGKPLLWLVDQQNVVIDGSRTPAAWIGIVGCSNIVIKNYEISNQFCGIMVADSKGWELRNVTVKHNVLGVLCINSGGSMYNCRFLGNNYHYGLIADILKPVGGGYVDIFTWENMKSKGFWGACRLFNVSFDGRSGVSFVSDQFCAPDGSFVAFESARVTSTEVVLYTTGGTVSYPIQGPPICLSAMDCRNPIVVEGMVARQMVTGVLVDSCSNVTVKDSMIEGCLFGVMHLGTSGTIAGLHIIDTTVERNHCVGVFLNTAGGGKLDLTRCMVRENGVGVCIWNGMQLSTWKDSIFINNTRILWWITGYALTTQLPTAVFAFAYSPGYDLYNCTFENLLFEGHMIDIFFEVMGAGLNRKNTFRGCVFKSSTGILALLGSLGPNLIYNNAFMTGFGIAAFEAGPRPFGSITWVNPGGLVRGTNVVGGPYIGGNYWMSYGGVDKDFDGIGDTPFVDEELGINDAYPLVLPQKLTIEVEQPSNGTVLMDNVVRLVWKGYATLNISQPVTVDYAVYVDGNLVNDTVRGDLFSAVECSIGGVSDGWHTVKIEGVPRGFDEFYGSTELMVGVDLQPPVVEITYPANGTVTGPVAVLTWNGWDSVGIDHYAIRVDDGEWWDVGLETQVPIQLSGGSHTLYVKAVDLAGRESVAKVTITVDDELPSIVIDAPSNGETLSSRRVTVRWTAVDNTGVEEARVYIDGTLMAVLPGTEQQYTVVVPSDGIHRIRVEVEDSVGYVAYDIVEVTVDTTPPCLSVLSPIDGQHVHEGVPILVNWFADDVASDVVEAYVRVDGGEWQPVEGDTYRLEGLTPGEHTIEVRVVDAAGNEAIVTVRVVVEAVPKEVRPEKLTAMIALIGIVACAAVAAGLFGYMFLKRKRG